MEDQHAEMCITFRVEIGRVKAHLDAGKHPSEIANALHRKVSATYSSSSYSAKPQVHRSVT
jgi:hypothetical protein